MLRSFHYASQAALLGLHATIRREDLPVLEPWARFWYLWVAATFLRGYVDTLGEAPLLPRDPQEFRILLDAYLLDKAIYELGQELQNRAEWLRVPLQGILQLVEPQ